MSLSKFSLEGKKALVVGARRNMGKAFALGLAEAGADVAVTDINIESGQLLKVSKEIEAMGRKSLALKADISSEKEVKKLVKTVVEEFRTIDILMNCEFPVSNFEIAISGLEIAGLFGGSAEESDFDLNFTDSIILGNSTNSLYISSFTRI